MKTIIVVEYMDAIKYFYEDGSNELIKGKHKENGKAFRKYARNSNFIVITPSSKSPGIGIAIDKGYITQIMETSVGNPDAVLYVRKAEMLVFTLDCVSTINRKLQQ